MSIRGAQPKQILKLLLMVGVAGLAGGCNLSTDSTAPPGPFYRITSDVKDSSTYPAGTILSIPIHVTFNGGAAGSASVHWSVLAGHGVISDTTSTTDTLGATHILWTLSAAAERNALVIAIGDAVDTLDVIGAVGSPSYLDLVGARSDTSPVGVPITLQVVVRDRPGNGVPGSTVNWTSSGGSLSTASTVSDGTGTATAAFAASVPGTYTVTADLPNLASLFFEVVVR